MRTMGLPVMGIQLRKLDLLDAGLLNWLLHSCKPDAPVI